MDEFMDEFMEAMRETFSNLLVQFEDFSTDNAFKYLSRFRLKYRCFNDDVSICGRILTISDAYIIMGGLDSRHGCGCAIGFPERGTPRIRGLWQATR